MWSSFPHFIPPFSNVSSLPEIVLCSLLNEFKFSPAKGKEIEWKMTGVVTPSVAGKTGPHLPLVVSPVG